MKCPFVSIYGKCPTWNMYDAASVITESLVEERGDGGGNASVKPDSTVTRPNLDETCVVFEFITIHL